MALVMSREHIKPLLKAPATARFARLGEAGVEIDTVAKCSYRVTAWVDAQNGFGAMLRTPYRMELRHDLRTDTWRAYDLVFAD